MRFMEMGFCQSPFVKTSRLTARRINTSGETNCRALWHCEALCLKMNHPKSKHIYDIQCSVWAEQCKSVMHWIPTPSCDPLWTFLQPSRRVWYGTFIKEFGKFQWKGLPLNPVMQMNRDVSQAWYNPHQRRLLRLSNTFQWRFYNRYANNVREKATW